MSRPTDAEIAELYPRLFRTALRLTGDPDRAGDATQQAFYRALRAWDEFDGRAARPTWMHSILVNCIRDDHRYRVSRPQESFDEWTIIPTADRDNSEEGHDRLVRVRQAVQKLPDLLRPAFVATVIDGLTYEQASALLSVPAGTIASRVYKARRLIRQAVGLQESS